MIGTVKSYDTRRGVGMITPARGGADIAVYVSEVERAGLASLNAGDSISYDVRTDRASGRSFAINLGAPS
ncbi:MAG TPA: cold shock domain-containing protein [Terricaulis sp.]|nr:cold shock domain-containing protein [Terricaulis sp.]